jgi:hypothetical protein
MTLNSLLDHYLLELLQLVAASKGCQLVLTAL